MTADKERSKLLLRSNRLREEIIAIFNDAAHWNRMHPTETIDPDPQGQLAAILVGLNRALVTEST